ncbi:MAG: dockerin type I repeat-containing protein [Armatimonadetes bacterium]|nr:dockerin type I repeat-containing protein [Armatimonadota bacterium]
MITWKVTGSTFALGDVDKSGNVNVSDAVIVLKASVDQVTLTSEEAALADVDRSGVVDVGDAVQILRKSVNLTAAF